MLGVTEHIRVNCATVDSPFGSLFAAATDRGLVRLAFPEQDASAVVEELAGKLCAPVSQSPAALDPWRRELEEYFGGSRKRFESPLDWSLIGVFAQKVLGATYAIPYGQVLTYSDVATRAGSPRGSRAAGNALGANPIPIVIPCHRVLRAGGSLGGYGGGLERKRHLLTLEGALLG
jgi:methylated-DNA-[protein]-cysteine S-methyltransferase